MAFAQLNNNCNLSVFVNLNQIQIDALSHKHSHFYDRVRKTEIFRILFSILKKLKIQIGDDEIKTQNTIITFVETIKAGLG